MVLRGASRLDEISPAGFTFVTELKDGQISSRLLNAAAAIYVADLADSMKSAYVLAERSLDSGAAQEKLARLVGRTNI